MKTFILIAVLIIDLVVGGLLFHFEIRPKFDLTIPTIEMLTVPEASGVSIETWEQGLVAAANFFLTILNLVIIIWNAINIVLAMMTFQVPNVSGIISGIFDVIHIAVILCLIPWS